MLDLKYADKSIIAKYRKCFAKIYPEFTPVFLGISQDKTCLIAETDFPDGKFYFRVSENSVSSAYKSKEKADK